VGIYFNIGRKGAGGDPFKNAQRGAKVDLQRVLGENPRTNRPAEKIKKTESEPWERRG